MKSLFILAGANGSGKSTVAKVLLPSEGLVYVNPDDIAKELNPGNPVAARIEAGKETLRRIDVLLERGESFAIESTLSGLQHLKTIHKAQKRGYVVSVIYVYVESPDVCIARIAARVRGGGHSVPDEDVQRRYVRSKINFVKRYRGVVDCWMLYYNGGMDLSLVAHGNGSLNVLSKERYDAFMEGLCLN